MAQQSADLKVNPSEETIRLVAARGSLPDHRRELQRQRGGL